MLFLGHGSPLNAIETNAWTLAFQRLGQQLRQSSNPPKAILMISAHWDQVGLRVSTQSQPKTIHDFGGFPAALYQQQYQAPGSTTLAARLLSLLQTIPATADPSWGFDHGCWSVLCHLFPAAELPVVQLSIDSRQTPDWHWQVGQLLASLRNEGVLIVASGNLVHNLALLNFQNAAAPAWAIDFRDKVKQAIAAGDRTALCQYQQWPSARLAVPHPDHLLPLFVLLGAAQADEHTDWFNDDFTLGNLAMSSLLLGDIAQTTQ